MLISYLVAKRWISRNKFNIFIEWPLGWFCLWVAMSVCLMLYVAPPGSTPFRWTGDFWSKSIFIILVNYNTVKKNYVLMIFFRGMICGCSCWRWKQVTGIIWQVTGDIWQVTSERWHLTWYMCQVTLDMLYIFFVSVLLSIHIEGFRVSRMLRRKLIN